MCTRIVLQALLAHAFFTWLLARIAVIPTVVAVEVAYFLPYDSMPVPYVTSSIVFIACCRVLVVAL